jgi:N-acylneuraminate cytidylyltransferase
MSKLKINNKRLLIIPARNGSKRLKNKNSKLFFRKPIILYSIENALKSKLFDKIVISSNDKKIEKISKRYNKKIILDQRPDKLANDDTPLLKVINYIYEKFNNLIKYNEIWILMPCAPLIDKQDLINAAKKLIYNKAITTVTENSIPIEWTYKIKNNILKPMFPKKMHKDSKSFSKSYREVGLFAAWKTQYFKKNIKSRKFNFSPYILNYFKSIDIDNQNDWSIAERIFKTRLYKS